MADDTHAAVTRRVEARARPAAGEDAPLAGRSDSNPVGAVAPDPGATPEVVAVGPGPLRGCRRSCGPPRRKVGRVERDAALALLPEAYADALQWRDDGAGPSLIAERLGIETEAVGPVMRIAESKLDALLRA